jgi:hypothetical protein
VRALLRRIGARRAAEKGDDLALHIDALVIVAAQPDDAVADEDHRRGDRIFELRRIGRGIIILAEHQSRGCCALLGGQHYAALARRLDREQRHLLQERALVACRPQASGIELRRDILRRDIEFVGAGLSALHRIGGEEHHMRLHCGLIGRQLGIDDCVLLGCGHLHGGSLGRRSLGESRKCGERGKSQRRG